MAKENKGYNFENFENDTLTKPRDKAWSNWWKAEKVGDKVQGYIRDAFYRSAEGLFKEQRGITIEQPNGELINVGIKRLPFILNKTDDLKIGDPLTIVFESENDPSQKGFSPTKVFSFYGLNLPENEKNKTVEEMEKEDMGKGGTKMPDEKDGELDALGAVEEIPFK